MIRLTRIILFLSCLAVGDAFAFTLTPVKVAPDVYAFIGDTGMRTTDNEGMNANTGFIVTGDGVVVIDSGPTWQVAKKIHRAIKTVTSQPVKMVVNTGGQDHRWLGNGYFKSIGAEIVAARPALADMQARGGMQLDGLRQTLGKKMAGTQPVNPDRFFDQSETLRLGGQEIRLLHFHGGHTPGDSVVWLPKQNVLFSGDLVFVDRMLGVFPFGSSRDWLDSFAAMEKLAPKLIVPGHGNICDLAQAQHDTRDYLRLLRSHMAQAVKDWGDLETAINTLDDGAYRSLRNFDSLHRFNASNVYLELENP
ncbi:MAG: MBL fold metallo-hydrolase [Hydrogenophilales bacterium CG_4_9_14_3_um_filter_59_35]|nr:MAG: MBL fold metallo-hydrolase [Hydrogenophilales bacterium CG18_big_fil_WC_8_21_14_2_50_58_12]PIY00971.1 MAG: MBL fold metallo-hydrolase [Hydrogenophilales bacterium CG_4_10_14_3_um_filter_58_23]PJB07561.1 MAG: MBL fold metallo-hydrolase [Hydrogenophilales bacterium CG_4_9_14_3_um_filter_59_35]